jgi:F-type H+-transporting ATPase subunit alpha
MVIETLVVSIFAGVNGFLDEIPLGEVRRYEQELLEVMNLNHRTLLDNIGIKKELTADMTGALTNILKEFTESFKATLKQ